MNDNTERDPRILAIPDTHGHAKGEHKTYIEERPLPLTARMLFLWFYHACRRGYPRFLMVADHMNYLTFEDPAAVNLVRRALKLAQAGDLYGAAETANVDVAHAAVVSEGLRRGMRYSIGAEVDNDPRSRPDAQNIVDAMRPDGIIRSVHFVPITHPVHGENWQWPFDNPEFAQLHEHVGTDHLWETYVTTLVDAIERLPGHIVGHFFVPAVVGAWPDDAKLSAYEDRVLAAAQARGMAVEFNTRFLYRENSDEEKTRYLDANKRFLRKARDLGVAIAIGSDAHSPKDQGGAFDVVLNVLDELEINEIVFPLGGQLRRVALRVVREPEPVPPPPPPAPEPVAAEPAPEAPAKPVRKARPKPAAARSSETSPERPPEREPSGDHPAPGGRAPAEPAPGAAPAAPPASANPAAPATAAAPGGSAASVSAEPGGPGDTPPAGDRGGDTKPPARRKRPAPPQQAEEARAPEPPPAVKAIAQAVTSVLEAAVDTILPVKRAKPPSAPKAAPPKAALPKAAPPKPAAAAKPPVSPAGAKPSAKAPPAKAGASKAAPSRPAAKPAATSASAKAAPSKASSKTSAGKGAPRKAVAAAAARKTAARPGSAKPAGKPTAKKGAAAKPAAKKAAPARRPAAPARAKAATSAKKAAAKTPARRSAATGASKKAAAKKPAPHKAAARKAPGRKAAGAKKTAAKKSATKRR